MSKLSFVWEYQFLWIYILDSCVCCHYNGTAEYPIHCHAPCYGSNLPEEWVFYCFATCFDCHNTIFNIWTLRICRKKFIVRLDNKSEIEMNKRMLLLPLLMMMILLFCNSMPSFIISSLTGLLLKQAGVEMFYGNWATIISKYEYFVLDLLHSLSYPLILLYLYNNVWKTWKKLFSCKLANSYVNTSVTEQEQN